MLAMHYRFTLKDQDQVAAIRRRAVERGPLFDLVPGLAHKWFLLDAKDPCYALFYLWRRPEAAQAFLEGELFTALSAAFGRPEVRLLLPVAVELAADRRGDLGIAFIQRRVEMRAQGRGVGQCSVPSFRRRDYAGAARRWARG